MIPKIRTYKKLELYGTVNIDIIGAIFRNFKTKMNLNFAGMIYPFQKI